MDLILDEAKQLSSANCDYYMSVRDFYNGSVEIKVKVIRPMSHANLNQRWQEGYIRGVPLSNQPELSDAEKEDKARENHARAVRRARQQVRYRVKALKATHLLTLTYRDCMIDKAQLKGDWQRFVRLVRARYPDWQYVAVPELQDRGAYHLHIAVVGRQDVRFLRKCWYVALGASSDATGDSTPGQIDLSGPQKRWKTQAGRGKQWREDKLAGYLIKYLDKTFSEAVSDCKRYWASKGVAVPAPVRFWIAATSMHEAIAAAVSRAWWLEVGSFDMWLSEDGTCFWLGGRPGDAEIFN